MSQIKGRISQIIGPVIDVFFDTKGEDPERYFQRLMRLLRLNALMTAN